MCKMGSYLIEPVGTIKHFQHHKTFPEIPNKTSRLGQRRADYQYLKL